jgi:hypothetical protein
MKTCTKCKETKSFDRYGRYSRTRDGLDTQCKDCRNKKAKTPEYRNQEATRTRWANGIYKGLRLGPGDY